MFPVARVCGGNILLAVYPASEAKPVEVEDVIIGGPKVERGFAQAPPGPGLGIDVNEKALRRFLTRGRSPVLVGKKN
jgi:L-alanine-DL-glutamate epimerase-like enolase superfamily enzyme